MPTGWWRRPCWLPPTRLPPTAPRQSCWRSTPSVSWRAGDLTLVENHLDGCPRCQAIVAACVRALPDLSEASSVHAGALDTGTRGGSWFAGWRWLVPITSVAAVAMVAVWIGRGPADQVAQQAGSEGATRDERVSEFRSAAPAPPAPASADTAGARNALADGEREADAGRLAAARANDAAATSATAQQERRPLRREDAQAKAAAAEQAADVRQLSEAAPAAAPATAPSPVAIAPAPAEAAEAVRAPARDAAAAPAEAVRAPATATMSARASGAAAGGARNEVGAARKQASSILTGTVTYRARVALPAGAVIEVRLLDVSRADPTSLRAGAPADTLARAEIVTRGEQVPVAFSLSYDPERDPGAPALRRARHDCGRGPSDVAHHHAASGLRRRRGAHGASDDRRRTDSLTA